MESPLFIHMYPLITLSFSFSLFILPLPLFIYLFLLGVEANMTASGGSGHPF